MVLDKSTISPEGMKLLEAVEATPTEKIIGAMLYNLCVANNGHIPPEETVDVLREYLINLAELLQADPHKIQAMHEALHDVSDLQAAAEAGKNTLN